MSKTLSEKLDQLQQLFREMNSVLVTFSGGVDSTFLAQAAHEVLGEKAVALTAVSPSLPQAELKEAQTLSSRIGIRHVVIESRELDDPRYASNPVNRCYFCKSELFSIAASKAKELGLSFVVDGTHLDDLKEVRPGRQAAREWQVRSPLVEAGLTKEEVREISRLWGLPTWDKPSMACLASRFPTGTVVTRERLSQVEACEAALKQLGFRQLRARYHGDAVRLELEQEGLSRIADPVLQEKVMEACRRSGFTRVVVDLDGYVSKA